MEMKIAVRQYRDQEGPPGSSAKTTEYASVRKTERSA